MSPAKKQPVLLSLRSRRQSTSFCPAVGRYALSYSDTIPPLNNPRSERSSLSKKDRSLMNPYTCNIYVKQHLKQPKYLIYHTAIHNMKQKSLNIKKLQILQLTPQQFCKHHENSKIVSQHQNIANSSIYPTVILQTLWKYFNIKNMQIGAVGVLWLML